MAIGEIVVNEANMKLIEMVAMVVIKLACKEWVQRDHLRNRWLTIATWRP